MKYELNQSYNGGGVVYVLKVRHIDQQDSRGHLGMEQVTKVIQYIMM